MFFFNTRITHWTLKPAASICSWAAKAFTIVLLTAISSSAGQIQLAWNPNGEPDLSGYRLYKRSAAQSYDYSTPVWQGTVTNCTITIDPGIEYCFVARAYNKLGVDSTNSNEVCYKLNSPPVANPQAISTNEDTPVAIKLGATDADGDILTFGIVSTPRSGTLSGTAPNLTYSPASNFSGSDSFSFKANDGKTDSAAVTVNITVAAVNDVPVAAGQAVRTNEDTPVAIKLGATDADGNTLTFGIVSAPRSGTLSGTAPNLTYSPASNFNGSDSFSFKASDGVTASAAVTVNITVAAVNDVPVAAGQVIAMTQGTLITGRLSGTDIDGDQLSYIIADQAGKGVATITDSATGAFKYQPPLSATGSDSFTFQVKDAITTSVRATVAITIMPANRPPTAVSSTSSTKEDTPVAFSLSGSDLDGDALTYRIVSTPANGTLSGTSPNLRYTPKTNYYGPDTIGFVANDGKYDSNIATVSISVTPVNDAPLADAGPDQIVDESAYIMLRGANSADPDGDALSFLWIQTAGTPVIINRATTQQPTFNAPLVGPQGESLAFKLTVTDPSGVASTDTCIINVTWRNDPPIANAGADQTINEGASVILNGTGSSDPDDGIAKYAWTQISGPSVLLQSSLSAKPYFTAPIVSLNGQALTFQLEVTDFGGLKSMDTIVVNISNINQPPVADAGAPQTVTAGGTVSLNGSGSYDLEGPISTYRWRQLSGSPVVLSNSIAANPFFMTPRALTGVEVITFELTVVDKDGLSATDVTSVDVLPMLMP